MALNLVKKFRDLAAVEANRPAIVRDQGCLPLLLSHISSSDSDIVIVALEGINFLSMCPENRPLVSLSVCFVISKFLTLSIDEK
mgnify:CR=1 FL=1